MNVKTKTICMAKVYSAIDEARTILNALEEKASKFASGEDVRMMDVVDQSLKMKEAREQILISFIEAGLDGDFKRCP
nr:MAG TPA: hypothetical protein [Caudoviricetes sp.]DAZ83265.1 MAG TPA: hypothetical protein [Caudoviricetes sp.]